jgi:hypothetical protein
VNALRTDPNEVAANEQASAWLFPSGTPAEITPRQQPELRLGPEPVQPAVAGPHSSVPQPKLSVVDSAACRRTNSGSAVLLRSNSNPTTAWPSRAAARRRSVPVLVRCWPLSIREITDFVVAGELVLGEVEVGAAHDVPSPTRREFCLVRKWPAAPPR